MGTLSLFRRVAADPTANTIVISAVALVPLLGMVGGAVDASRYYMTTTRLQAACDAGALAARRQMGDDTFTADDRQTGLNFFDQNFEDGQFGSDTLTRNYVGDNDGKVKGTASAKLPTSLMHIFGYDEFDLSVNCTADINISNTDIMFVVDVTGSMNCAPSNPTGGACGNTEDTGAKIKGLRNAVMTFYDTVDNSTASTAQIRYGMVPYASNVNVGAALMAENSDWLVKSHTYQSREANIETSTSWNQIAVNVTNIDPDNNEFYRGLSRRWSRTWSQSACDALKPADFDNDIRTGLGTHEGLLNEVVNGNIRTRSYHDGNETIWRGEGYSNYRPGNGWCDYGWSIYEDRADISFDIVDELETTTAFENWTYKPVTYDLTTLYDDNSIDLPIGNQGADFRVDWDGCVEESDTVSNATFSTVPSNAYDLDINLVPSNDAERWKPVLYGATWKRETSSGNHFGNLTQSWNESRPNYHCPAAAFRLTDISRNNLQTYVNSLVPRSATYHDIGMIWGARFISPNGIFSADNASAPNGDAISRNIVFMTDGILSPYTEIYNPYGIEWWDRRITDDGGYSQAASRHAERFQAACRAARQENISVWVVAFGTALSQNLIDCATPGRAFVASDSAELEARFQEIAQKIAALRLTE